jgi:hypothetical protein
MLLDMLCGTRILDIVELRVVSAYRLQAPHGSVVSAPLLLTDLVLVVDEGKQGTDTPILIQGCLRSHYGLLGLVISGTPILLAVHPIVGQMNHLGVGCFVSFNIFV